MADGTALPRPMTHVRPEFGALRLQDPFFSPVKRGSFVAVRVAGEEKTRLGLYLGDLPVGVGLGIPKDEKDTTLVLVEGRTNPAIYCFETQQLVYGFESWWGRVESPEHLRDITDGDIENVWYVQALKALQEREAQGGKADNDA